MSDARVVMSAISDKMAMQMHECIPLGWRPEPVAGTYFEGYTASVDGEGMWLPPMWAVRIADRDRKNPKANSIFRVLNELVRAGVLSRERHSHGFDYHLTMKAIPYFYALDHYNDNREDWPYLCYSTIKPTRVLWIQKPHDEYDNALQKRERVFRVQFSWVASKPPSWAEDPLLRQQSVVLPPTTSPTVAKFVDWDGYWQIENIYSPGLMLPALR